MINEIIDLLPSADLKAKIRETDHRFTETQLLQILYRYAPNLHARIDLLERFAGIASPEVSAQALRYAARERESLSRFMNPDEGFIYELCIKENPDSYEEKYLCATYPAALTCIDRFFEEYADICTHESPETRYSITKRKIFSEGDRFEEDAYAVMELGAGKTILEVSDYRSEEDDGSHELDEDVRFPCFVKHRTLVKYRDYDGAEHFAVCLCWREEGECDGLVDFYYVIPLDCPTIREHRFHGDGHDHIEAPRIEIASPEELDAVTRKNYFAYLAYLDTQQAAKLERIRKGLALCDECGSEYYASASQMDGLCPECAHILYGYEACHHVFEDGKCTLCLWDGSRSEYIRSLIGTEE